MMFTEGNQELDLELRALSIKLTMEFRLLKSLIFHTHMIKQQTPTKASLENNLRTLEIQIKTRMVFLKYSEKVKQRKIE